MSKPAIALAAVLGVVILFLGDEPLTGRRAGMLAAFALVVLGYHVLRDSLARVSPWVQTVVLLVIALLVGGWPGIVLAVLAAALHAREVECGRRRADTPAPERT